MKQACTWTAVRLGSTAFALIITASAALAQDYTVRMSGDDSTCYISRKAVRKTFPTVNTDVIYRLEEGKVIYLDDQQKTYRVLTLAEARARLSQGAGQMPPQQREMFHRMGFDEAPTVTRLGAGETIAGYGTEKYLVATPAIRAEIWVAPSLELPEVYYDANTLLKQATLFDMSRFDAEMRKIKGMILKRVVTTHMLGRQGPGGTEVATSVQRAPIPASTFEIPAGYKPAQPAR